MNNAINKIIVKLSSFSIVPPKFRRLLLNHRIGEVSPKCQRINSKCYFCGNRIYIGDGCFVNVFCRFFSHYESGSEIVLEENCVLGMGVTIDTHTHLISTEDRKASCDTVFKPVVIGKGAWVGANATILSGVKSGGVA